MKGCQVAISNVAALHFTSYFESLFRDTAGKDHAMVPMIHELLLVNSIKETAITDLCRIFHQF